MPRPVEPGPESPQERPSKTRLKQQSHELQALGESLAELPDDKLARLPADESLIDAVREYKRTRSHEGRRRQMQYIGKLMRLHDDITPLREAVAELKLPGAQATLALHQAELWRQQLIADDGALTRWMNEHPDSDAQQLRSLIRAARLDGQRPPEERQGKAFRELFQFIKKAEA